MDIDIRKTPGGRSRPCYNIYVKTMHGIIDYLLYNLGYRLVFYLSRGLSLDTPLRVVFPMHTLAVLCLIFNIKQQLANQFESIS